MPINSIKSQLPALFVGVEIVRHKKVETSKCTHAALKNRWTKGYVPAVRLEKVAYSRHPVWRRVGVYHHTRRKMTIVRDLRGTLRKGHVEYVKKGSSECPCFQNCLQRVGGAP